MRVGGVVQDAPPEFLQQLEAFCKIIDERIDEYAYLLQDNEIFRSRTIGIGYLSKEEIIDLGLSGPLIRAAGIGLGCAQIRNLIRATKITILKFRLASIRRCV